MQSAGSFTCYIHLSVLCRMEPCRGSTQIHKTQETHHCKWATALKHKAVMAAHQAKLSPCQQFALPAPDPGGVQLAQPQAQEPDHQPPRLPGCLQSWSCTGLTMPAQQIVQLAQQIVQIVVDMSQD